MNYEKKSPPLDIEQAFIDHAHWLLTAVQRRVPNAPRVVVEDACSITWTIALRHAHKLQADPPHRLRGWLALVGQREAWRLLKRETPALAEDLADTLAATVPGDDETAKTLDRMDLDALIADVSDFQRPILILYGLGFTYKEIAAALEISETAVNKAIVRIKNRARG